MPKKRRYFVHFEITSQCMSAGMRQHGSRSQIPDVFDVLAEKMRANNNVRQMLQLVATGGSDKVCVGVGREYEE